MLAACLVALMAAGPGEHQRVGIQPIRARR